MKIEIHVKTTRHGWRAQPGDCRQRARMCDPLLFFDHDQPPVTEPVERLTPGHSNSSELFSRLTEELCNTPRKLVANQSDLFDREVLRVGKL